MKATEVYKKLEPIIHESFDLWCKVNTSGPEGRDRKLVVLCSPSLREGFIDWLLGSIGESRDLVSCYNILEQNLLSDLVGLKRGAIIITDDSLEVLSELARCSEGIKRLASENLKELL